MRISTLLKSTVALAACVSVVAVAPSADAASDLRKKPRPKPTVAAAPPLAPASAARVTVASYNVCKVTCAAPAPDWSIRRDRVARNILESGADVIGLQEATNWATPTAATQIDDIRSLVAPGGYTTPTYSNEANECRRPRDAAGQLAGPSPCENTSQLLFRTSSVSQVALPSGQDSAGILQAQSIAPGIDAASAFRSVAWAYLTPQGSKPILFVSMHTDSAKTPESEAARVALGQALGGWVEAFNAQHGMSGTKAVLLADLNSFEKRQPMGAQRQLTDRGWFDAFNATTRVNERYSTINYNPRLADGAGFPARPYLFAKTKKNPTGSATRIDYIMAYGGGVSADTYEVAIRLNADGTFNADYQGSDHQMVKATLAFS